MGGGPGGPADVSLTTALVPGGDKKEAGEGRLTSDLCPGPQTCSKPPAGSVQFSLQPAEAQSGAGVRVGFMCFFNADITTPLDQPDELLSVIGQLLTFNSCPQEAFLNTDADQTQQRINCETTRAEKISVQTCCQHSAFRLSSTEFELFLPSDFKMIWNKLLFFFFECWQPKCPTAPIIYTVGF